MVMDGLLCLSTDDFTHNDVLALTEHLCVDLFDTFMCFFFFFASFLCTTCTICISIIIISDAELQAEG